LLNDLPILAIAYDRTKVSPYPVRWKMSEMLAISTILGVTGVVGSFLLFFILRESGFPETVIQSMMFLKLIVAGHSTLYITRTDGWFWRRPWPVPLLFWATLGTEVLGTFIVVYGVLMTPIGWKYALWMWAYALLWFVIDNAAKMLGYRLLRPRAEMKS
jgi:H+-transporting ATPase